VAHKSDTALSAATDAFLKGQMGEFEIESGSEEEAKDATSVAPKQHRSGMRETHSPKHGNDSAWQRFAKKKTQMRVRSQGISGLPPSGSGRRAATKRATSRAEQALLTWIAVVFVREE
jgi:hypothetical protein